MASEAGQEALQLRSITAVRQHLALADMVGGADDPLRFHALDDPRGAIVTDLKMALHKARRRLTLAPQQIILMGTKP